MIDRREFDDLERRVLALERRLARSRRRWSNIFPLRRRSDLWIFEQYSPREIKIPPSYHMNSYPNDGCSVAIVTPSYNHAQYIKSTIHSVLSQQSDNISYHVQDGGSNDATTEILDTFGTRISSDSRPDRGQTHAINLGFERVSGDIMAYLNSDDCLLPGAVPYVLDYFRRNSDVDVVYGHRIFVDRFGDEVGRAVLPPHDSQALKWADYIPQETMFWRRKVWDSVGPFDETFNFAMDWDFILRAQEKGFRFARLPRFLGAFRVHDQQKTAALIGEGEAEMARLRQSHLGAIPTRRDINAALRPYLRKQANYSMLYRLGLIRH